MQIFLQMIPPTTTAQQKKINTKTKTIYANQSVLDAKNKYRAHLAKYVPKEPLVGALSLLVVWGFPAGKHKNGDLCMNKPDLDNACKLLQDVMQELGFFKDDKDIVQLNLSKIWTVHPGVMIEIERAICKKCFDMDIGEPK